MIETRRYQLLAGAAVLHAALPITLGLLGVLAGARHAVIVAIVSLWWIWPFIWLYPLWRARYDDPRAWWTALVLSFLLLGWAAPGMLFLTAVLGGAKT